MLRNTDNGDAHISSLGYLWCLLSPNYYCLFYLVYSYFENVVGKSARDNPETSLLFKETWKNGTRGHGRMFATAKGKQQR